jgi:hypothetical protein
MTGDAWERARSPPEARFGSNRQQERHEHTTGEVRYAAE